jgi:hypothetical protein
MAALRDGPGAGHCHARPQALSPAVSAPALPPGALVPGGVKRAGRHTQMHACPAAHIKPGHAASPARPWPSVETSGYTDRATGPDAVRYTSVDTAT